LMLADYPNPDGWRLYKGDVFTSDTFYTELQNAAAVVSNPPFEAFSPQEREAYNGTINVQKPAELIERLLQNPPRLLGLVLPRIFLRGRSYARVRKKLFGTYR